MKWFTFNQNNSGGFFVDDENVCECVIIQAETAEDASRFARRIMDNSDSCPCCGDRWNFYVDETDGYDVPSVYGEPLIGKLCSLGLYKRERFRRKAILHYANGERQTVELTSD